MSRVSGVEFKGFDDKTKLTGEMVAEIALLATSETMETPWGKQQYKIADEEMIVACGKVDERFGAKDVKAAAVFVPVEKENEKGWYGCTLNDYGQLNQVAILETDREGLYDFINDWTAGVSHKSDVKDIQAAILAEKNYIQDKNKENE